jgi:hypothetical protein
VRVVGGARVAGGCKGCGCARVVGARFLSCGFGVAHLISMRLDTVELSEGVSRNIRFARDRQSQPNQGETRSVPGSGRLAASDRRPRTFFFDRDCNGPWPCSDVASNDASHFLPGAFPVPAAIRRLTSPVSSHRPRCLLYKCFHARPRMPAALLFVSGHLVFQTIDSNASSPYLLPRT